MIDLSSLESSLSSFNTNYPTITKILGTLIGSGIVITILLIIFKLPGTLLKKITSKIKDERDNYFEIKNIRFIKNKKATILLIEIYNKTEVDLNIETAQLTLIDKNKQYLPYFELVKRRNSQENDFTVKKINSIEVKFGVTMLWINIDTSTNIVTKPKNVLSNFSIVDYIYALNFEQINMFLLKRMKLKLELKTNLGNKVKLFKISNLKGIFNALKKRIKSKSPKPEITCSIISPPDISEFIPDDYYL